MRAGGIDDHLGIAIEALRARVGRNDILAIRRDIDVVRIERGRNIQRLVVAYLRPVDRQHANLVHQVHRRESALAVGCDGDRGDFVVHRYLADCLHRRPLDQHHRDALARAVADQRQITLVRDHQARRLLSNRDGIDQLRRIGGQVDDEQLVVHRHLPRAAVLVVHHRIGHQPELAVRCDLQIGRRTEQRVHQRQARADLGLRRVGYVHDQDRVVAGRPVHLAVRAIADLFVKPDQDVVTAGPGGRAQQQSGRCKANG